MEVKRRRRDDDEPWNKIIPSNWITGQLEKGVTSFVAWNRPGLVHLKRKPDKNLLTY